MEVVARCLPDCRPFRISRCGAHGEPPNLACHIHTLPEYLSGLRSGLTYFFANVARYAVELFGRFNMQLPENFPLYDELQQTRNRFVVPVEEQAELKRIVNSTRSDILVASGAALA
jgi:hypothetical protein